MTLDKRTIALISVGASVAANCHPCLEHHAAKAREAGLTDEEILAAAEVAKTVKAGAGKSMDQLIAKLTGESSSTRSGCGPNCGC